MARLGLDFGTSNTGVAILADGQPRTIELEPGAETLPTAVFVDFSARRYVYGSAAAQAMREGYEGRFMRALKSILGTSLAREPRMLLNERMTLIEVIARFLGEIKQRSENQTGLKFDSALSGRPVRFHSASEARNAQAIVDLEEAYLLAGFQSVEFLAEPEAAALAVEGHGRMLIVDIGGGTSDFSLCERYAGKTEIKHSRGIRLGGTDFDKTLSLEFAMPLFGYGSEIGSEFGSATHTAPRAMFHDLASWEKIPFVYDGRLLRDVGRWIRLAQQPRQFERLQEILRSHLGHDVAYAVEAGKIAANGDEVGSINLNDVEAGLTVDLRQSPMNGVLASYAQDIAKTALETLKEADCNPSSVDQVVYVGGSSLLRSVRAAVESALPNAKPIVSEVFTAVVHGLAIAADRPVAKTLGSA